MVALGFLLLWGGYAQGLFGWCLWQGYDVTFGQLVSPLHPYSGPWPPQQIPSGQTWPGRAPAAQTAAGNIGGLIAQGAESAAANSVTNSTKAG